MATSKKQGDGASPLPTGQPVLRPTLRHIADLFAKEIKAKIDQYHAAFPAGQMNSDVAGIFIEELVREFVSSWIAPCVIASGTLTPVTRAGVKPYVPQIDGIVYDPTSGPPTVKCGNAIIVDPAFCRGIIEIKKSDTQIAKLRKRLLQFHQDFFYEENRSSYCNMGIIIHDKNPVAKSKNGSVYKTNVVNQCPVYILFKLVDGVALEPHLPAIEAMIHNIYLNITQRQLPVRLV